MLVPNWRGAVVDGTLVAVLANEHGVVRQSRRRSLAKRPGRRVFNRLAGFFVNDPKDGVEGLTQRIALRPTRQRLGDRIQVGDAALDIGGDDGVANAPQRDPEQFATLGGTVLRDPHRFAEPDDQGAGEEVGDETDDGCDAVNTEYAARFDEQIGTGDVPKDGD